MEPDDEQQRARSRHERERHPEVTRIYIENVTRTEVTIGHLLELHQLGARLRESSAALRAAIAALSTKK